MSRSSSVGRAPRCYDARRTSPERHSHEAVPGSNDNDPYDLVARIDGEFYRLQVKTAYDGKNDGAVEFRTRSVRTKSEGYERAGYDGKIDYFAVLNVRTEDVYLVPIEDAGAAATTIRYEPAANNNRTNINWHEEYRIDTVLSRLQSG